ncbi:MAG: hypothetical protein K6G40_09520 [Eubacterium sp.]|nr:hypothetical protein [Eubacterium sp.]
MQKNTKNITEYVVDRDWSLWVVCEADTEIFLFNKKSRNAKFILKEKGSLENPDEYILEVIRNMDSFKDDIVFDKDVDPRHIVEEISKLYKTCRSENEYRTNLAYMILGAISKSYNDMKEAGDGFYTEEADMHVNIMKSAHRVGEMLESVESNNGLVNAVAKNKTSPF